MAGKKRDGGSVKVKITDDGSLKNLGKNAKKAGKDVGSVAKNVQESDRRLKSLSNQTSSSTKAFSKQAQTIGGGLVPIYATIAAQVFAVSAAFRFLQDAMETRNMVEGQKAFGAITGNAFQTVTVAVQKATANMLSFKEAASAVAIGTAAGLTRGQLEDLGTVAKNASLALGRDLTDAFNRLIRGVTKAEPELLDELGIILRLEPATEKYAVAIGKARTELTAFERSQAVANEVLDQGMTKFGRITQIMDEDAFVLGQFAKEFDDLTKIIKLTVAETLIPIVGFLKDNIASLIGVFGLLAAPIISQIIPDFSRLGKMFDSVASSSKAMATQASGDMKLMSGLKSGGDIGKAAQKDFMTSGRSGMQAMLSGQDMSQQSATLKKAAQGKKLNAKELGVLKRHLKQKNNLIGNFHRTERIEFDRYIKHQELGLKGNMTKAKLEYKQLGLATNKYWAGTKMVSGNVLSGIVSGAAFAGRALTKLLSAFGYISVFIIAFQAIKSFFGKKDVLTAAEQQTKDFTEELKLLNEELERMVMVRNEGLLTGGAGFLEQMSNSLKTGDLMSLIKDFNQEMVNNGGIRGETKDRFLRMAHNLEKLVPGMKTAGKEGASLSDTFENAIENIDTIDLSKKNPFLALANDIMAAGQSLAQFNAQMQELDKQKLSIVTGTKARPFSKMIDSINSATGKSGSLGSNALAQEKMALNTAREFLASRKEYRDMLQSMLNDQGQGTTFFARKQAAGLTGESTGTSKKASVGKFNQGLVNQIESLAQGSQGLDIINTALGTNFEDAAEAMEHVRKEVGGSKDGKGGLVEVGDRLRDVYNNIFGKLGLENIEQLNNLLQEETEQLQDSTRSHREKVELSNQELKIKTFLQDENDKMFKLSEKNHQLALDTLDLSVKAGADEIRRGKYELETRKEINALERARSDLRTSQFILEMSFEKATETQKQNLLDQVELAKQKVALAEKELQITTELLSLPFEKFMDKTREMQTLQSEGSYTNSFFNKRNAFLQQDSSKNYIEGQGKESLARSDQMNDFFKSQGMEEFVISDDEKQERMLTAQQTALQNLNDEFILREKINGQLKLQNDISTRLTEGLANDMAGALVEVAKGTKTMKEAFGQMAISILADITKMIIRQLILNALMAMVGMVNPGAAAALTAMPGLSTGARQGGVMSPGAGGGYRSYRSGGVADGPEAGYPATLHGTEAVVPLGNDKSIPVKMLEGSSGTNNVTVNVTMSDGGATQDIKTEGEKAKAFGASISAAVQQEIVKQQRTGGLLNSY